MMVVHRCARSSLTRCHTTVGHEQYELAARPKVCLCSFKMNAVWRRHYRNVFVCVWFRATFAQGRKRLGCTSSVNSKELRVRHAPWSISRRICQNIQVSLCVRVSV